MGEDRIAPSLASLSPDKLRKLIAVGQSLVSSLDVNTLLSRLLDTARELTGAHYAALGILDRDRVSLEQFRYLGIDDKTREEIGDLPTGRGVLGALISHPTPLRLEDVAEDPRSVGFPANHPPMRTFLGVPVTIAGEAWGNLYLTEKEGGEQFTHQDEALAIVLAGWTGIAVANARAASSLRANAVLAASDNERRRWARELHDQTLQSLGGLRVMLSSALRSHDPERLAEAAESAVENLGGEIEALRRLARELRPASLDELGLPAAIEALADRAQELHGIEVEVEIDPSVDGGERRFDERTETAVYRIVGEALNNTGKHSGASKADVKLGFEQGNYLVAEVSDDGKGFDPGGRTEGLGLVGMRERADLASGRVSIESAPGKGTVVRVGIPTADEGDGPEPYGTGV